jgi:gliding motility-associated-like protein
MSLKDNNIEELFRSGLEDFELPVNDTMWNSISNQIGNTTAATSASSSGIFGIATKTLIISAVSLSAAIVGGIALNNYFDTKETESKTVNVNPPTDENNSENIFEENSNSNSEYIVLLDNISQEQTEAVNDITNQVEEKPSTSKSVVTVTSKNVKYKSVAQMFLSPPSTSVSSPQPIDSKSTTSSSSNLNQSTPNTLVEVKIEELKPEQIIASISAMPVGGFAPLEVSFMQQSEYSQINWDFGDGKQSKEAKPTHVFEKFGKYTVTLTLTDSKGKQYKDTRIIEVLPNSAITRIPNIFTPNNDGNNDYFFVESKNIEEYHLMIMDVKGNLIYTTKNIDDKWDGITLSGTLISEGQYIVILAARGTDGKIFEFKTPLKVQ